MPKSLISLAGSAILTAVNTINLDLYDNEECDDDEYEYQQHRMKQRMSHKPDLYGYDDTNGIDKEDINNPNLREDEFIIHGDDFEINLCDEGETDEDHEEVIERNHTLTAT